MCLIGYFEAKVTIEVKMEEGPKKEATCSIVSLAMTVCGHLDNLEGGVDPGCRIATKF